MISTNGIDNLPSQEEIVAQNFEKIDQELNQQIIKALSCFHDYILNIGPVYLHEYPKSTINLFMGSNFDLLYQAYNLFKRGYFRPSMILLRPVFESIALCMYFSEFPAKEVEYRATPNKNSWYYKQGRCPAPICSTTS